MPRKSRVLFVCLGNACRSPMAEGFARAHGADVMEAESAGLAPAIRIPEPTVQVMHERNIDVSEHEPREILSVQPERFDLIVNMSGYPIPPLGDALIHEWTIRDPIGCNMGMYREVADAIERRVMDLIHALRGGLTTAAPPKHNG